MADGKLSFFSFVRRGLATALTKADTAPAGTDHTLITLNVTPGVGTAPAQFALVDLSLTGPGDIVGLDPTVVVRTWPKPDDFDAEFIPYPLIEFDQADLPWRYTPATRTGEPTAHTDHLRPWFSLVVVPAALAKIDPPTPKQKLPILTVALIELPPRLDLWAFAHTQFTGEGLSDQAVKGPLLTHWHNEMGLLYAPASRSTMAPENEGTKNTEPLRVGLNLARPSDFLRARRPERFSDTPAATRVVLGRDLLSYKLSTLTSTKQEVDFEDFARRLAEREICPNLLPQTGPTGGGDSKTDASTYPVARRRQNCLLLTVGSGAAQPGVEPDGHSARGLAL